MKNIFASNTGIIITGIAIGVIAPLLQFLGNPANMGICVACFERDITGALGLHRAAVVQYIRPEIIGFVLGSFIVSLIFKEHKPRGGSSAVIRFFLGLFAMIGALVFLGCPWRTFLRIAGGDGNAIFGLLGLVAGIFIGVLFLKHGYSLGRSMPAKQTSGWLFPVFMLSLLALLITGVSFSEGGPVFASVKGPGSQHAPIIASIAAGLVIGGLAQRSRFCTMGAIRDILIAKDFHLAFGILAFAATAWLVNITLGQFNPGFANQPVAHTNELWNFGGMVLAGLAFTLAGGCPGRQLILSGEGDGDAAVFVLGMMAGAACAHNFSLASSGAGTGAFGPAAVIIGLVFCIAIGFAMKERTA